MDKKLLKQISLAFLFVLFLNLGFFYLKILLFVEDIEYLNSLILFLIFFLFGAIFFIFLILTKPSLKLQIPIYFLVLASTLFWFGVSGYMIVGELMFSFFLFLAQIILRQEEKNLLKFSFCRLSRKGYGTFLTGTAILISILLFLSPKILGGEITLPRPLFDWAWPMIERVLSSQYPGFNGDMTVDQFIILQMSGNIEQILERYQKPEIENQSSGPSLPFGGEQIEIELQKEIQKQLEEAKKSISEEILQQGREEFAEAFQIGKKLKGDEKMKDIFYGVITNLIAQNIKSWKEVGTTGLILIFFMMIKTVSIFLNYILLLISWLIFKILIAMKFFAIKTVKVDKEELTI